MTIIIDWIWAAFWLLEFDLLCDWSKFSTFVIDWTCGDLCLVEFELLCDWLNLSCFVIAVVDCLTLTQPINTQTQTLSTTTFNTSYMFTCMTGHKFPSGATTQTTTCLANATWSYIEPACQGRRANFRIINSSYTINLVFSIYYPPLELSTTWDYSNRITGGIQMKPPVCPASPTPKLAAPLFF